MNPLAPAFRIALEQMQQSQRRAGFDAGGLFPLANGAGVGGEPSGEGCLAESEFITQVKQC